VFRGLATMVAFGFGTVPAMIAAGLGGSVLGLAARRRLHAAAAWCLVVTGAISIARGAGHLSWSAAPPPGCPFCAASGADEAIGPPQPLPTSASPEVDCTRRTHVGGLTVSTATAAAVPTASSRPMSRPTP